jgi:hypothetical protein
MKMLEWIKMFIQGWSRRLTGKTSEESERRLKICMECKDKIRITSKEYICSHCGCPIRSAVLADKKKCDMNKW